MKFTKLIKAEEGYDWKNKKDILFKIDDREISFNSLKDRIYWYEMKFKKLYENLDVYINTKDEANKLDKELDILDDLFHKFEIL